MALNRAGGVVALAGRDGTAQVVAVPATPCNHGPTDLDPQLGMVREPLGSAIGSVQFSADGTAADRLQRRHRPAVELADRSPGPAGSRSRRQPTYAAALSPDGSDLVTADGGGTATVFNARTGKQLTAVGYAQGGRLTAIAYTSDGGQLVTGGFDGRVSVWSAQLAAPVCTVRRIALSRVRTAVPGAELSDYQRAIR